MREDDREHEESSVEPEAASSRNATENQADGAEGDPTSEVDPGPRSPEAAGTEELEAVRERYLRLAAEFDNYRKRVERERVEARDRAQAQLVERLLEPLDDLQRVAHFGTETATLEALLEGVQMVERKFMRALESAGLELVDARGQRFDPGEHDALMMAATEDAEQDETVGEVFQAGYRFRGSLLRPARVQVMKFGG